MADTTPPLAKYLASTDKKTRDKAVKSLAAFLSTTNASPLPKPEMAKLWKGIFYCYWMSDKPLVQQALSSELADLLLLIDSPLPALAFLDGFWEAIVREWNGIDRLRMDKYYMLVRKFVNASFRLLRRSNWQPTALQSYHTIMISAGGPLCPDDARMPSSLTYHIVDLYLEELNKSLSMPLPQEPKETAKKPVPILSLLDPFFTLAALTSSKVTYSRIYEGLIDPLLSQLQLQSSLPSPSTEDGPSKKRPRLSASQEPDFDVLFKNVCIDQQSDERATSQDLRRSILRSLFDKASGQDAREANRRKLYALWRSAMAEDEDGTSNGDVDAS